jgi:hypothetical protein
MVDDRADAGAVPSGAATAHASVPAPSRRVDPQFEFALADSIRRLELVVDEEAAALTMRQPIDLDGINRRKSHGLLELTRLSRSLAGRAASSDLGPDLARLAAKLQRSRALLRLRLVAAQEIAGLITDAMRAADSDGTYSTASVAGHAGRRR